MYMCILSLLILLINNNVVRPKRPVPVFFVTQEISFFMVIGCKMVPVANIMIHVTVYLCPVMSTYNFISIAGELRLST